MVRSKENVFWNQFSGYGSSVELPLPKLWACNNLSFFSRPDHLTLWLITTKAIFSVSQDSSETRTLTPLFLSWQIARQLPQEKKLSLVHLVWMTQPIRMLLFCSMTEHPYFGCSVIEQKDWKGKHRFGTLCVNTRNYPSFPELLGSFGKHDVAGSENVIWKCTFAFLQSFFNYSKSLCLKNLF